MNSESHPLPGGRDRRFEEDFRFLHRVDEADGASVERDAAVGVGARRTVLEVALDGAADVGELTTDLVVAAGEEFDFHQVVPLGALQVRVLEFRFLRLSPGALGDKGFVKLLVAGHPVCEKGRFRRRLAAAQRPIGLMDLPRTEHRIQPLQGLGRLGEKDKPAHGTVKAVRDAHEHLAGLAVPLGDEGLERLAHGLITRLVTLDNLTCPFVENEQVVVLKENPGREVPEFPFVKRSVNAHPR